MNEPGGRVQLPVIPDLFPDEIFHRFHVVVGGFFDLFDPAGISRGEITEDRFKFPVSCRT